MRPSSKGSRGFGEHSVVHAARVVDLSADLPILVELIDVPEKIREFVPVLRSMLHDGMITLENVAVIYRNAGSPRP